MLITVLKKKVNARLKRKMVVNMWRRSFIIVLLLVSATCGKATSLKKRVCVIGAGVAGLQAANIVSQYPDEFEPIVYERQSDIGGNWIYTDSTTVDDNGLPVHSSVYKYLRINFPKELEAPLHYREFRGDESKGSFVDHTEMLNYLRNYTTHFNLRKYIKLNTLVEQVSPLPRMRWLVASRDLKTKARNEIKCDAVIVGNGNNFKGRIPKLPGIKSFPGRVIHSHFYRYPEEFTNQTVLVLGASYSGTDISIDISRFAKKIYLSHRHDRFTFDLPKNVEQVWGVVGVNGSNLILSDDSKVKVDAVILCTGYDYDYPFLDRSSGIYVDDGKYVRSVYKHFINIERPTMAILNLPIPGLPLSLPYVQTRYFVKVLRGEINLPCRSEMLKDAALPPNVPKSKAHYMVEAFIPYYQEIATAAGEELLPNLYIKAVFTFLPHIFGDPYHFREKKLHYTNNGGVEFY